MDSNYRQDVIAEIRDSKIHVVGYDDIVNEPHARAVIATLKAYGDSPQGFVYIEPCTADNTIRPPDVLICHPDLGLLIIEVKGYKIEDIQGIEAGNFYIRKKGRITQINAFRQAEKAMFDIKNAVERRLNDQHNSPLFNYVVALPNVSEVNWKARGYDQSVQHKQLIFQDQLDNVRLFKKHINIIIAESLSLSNKKSPIDVSHVASIKEAFGDSQVINDKRSCRRELIEDTIGTYIDTEASKEKQLSSEQQELSRIDITGYPRLIRGVAGSGKTVVLANIVARFIGRHYNANKDMFDEGLPNLKVGVFCFNRTLVPFLRDKIHQAYQRQQWETLPSNTATIDYLNSIIYKSSYSEKHNSDNIQFLDYIRVNDALPSERATEYIKQLQSFASTNPELYKSTLYDAIFIDEGQDLVPEDYQFFLELIKVDPITNEKQLIIFYDDAQNVYGRPRPNWKQVGIDVQRGGRARVMKECFRNTKEIITIAYNILLGSQAPADLSVQTRTFADVNYLKQEGMVEELDGWFKINYAENTYEKPPFQKFTSNIKEKEWIIDQVVELVNVQHVRPDDILLLFKNKQDCEKIVQMIKSIIGATALKGIIEPYKDKDQYIFREGHLTVSTIASAKGYDAYIVFLGGIDTFDPANNKDRAMFYVGATRAKLLLYLSGLEDPHSLVPEVERICNRV